MLVFSEKVNLILGGRGFFVSGFSLCLGSGFCKPGLSDGGDKPAEGFEGWHSPGACAGSKGFGLAFGEGFDGRVSHGEV